MSQLETADNKIYEQSFVLVAGVGAVVNPATFNASSRLLSIVRTVVGGTPGVPHCRVVSPNGIGASSVWGLGVFSADVADTSTYTVYWTQQYQASPNYLQTGATIGVQFRP
jgi:hypothetical protein